MSEPGSTTTPQPITQRQPLCRIPEGIVCSTYFSRPTTTVWPALLPPEKRTTTSTCGVMTSTTLPLPSSPHCAPITTMFLDMSCPSHSLEALGRIREDLGHRQRALAAAARQRGAEAGDVGLEVEAGIVVEAAHLAEVEQHRVGEPVDAQQPVDLGQVGERARGARVLGVAAGALQHDLAPEQRRQRQE